MMTKDKLIWDLNEFVSDIRYNCNTHSETAETVSLFADKILSKLSQHDVIKNEVAVCDNCNGLGGVTLTDKCEWCNGTGKQTVL